MEIELKAALPLDRNPAAVYLARLAPTSRVTMRSSLERVAAILTAGRLGPADVDWSAVRYQHAAAVRAKLAAEVAPATANRILAALRGVLKETWRLGYLSAEVYHRTVDLEPVRGERLPKGRALEREELRRLLDFGGDGPRDLRDAALLAVLFGAGLRRAEAVGLDLRDYDPASGRLLVRGKGNKERVSFICNGFKVRLDRWVEARGQEAGPLFRGIKTPQAVYQIVKRRGRQAGLDAFTPHDLRRTFASELLDAGADLPAVQALMGHASPKTTVRYDRRGERAKQKAAALLYC